jgi:TolA-binding protein
MAQKITRKSLKHDEFVEAAFDVEQWFESHWKPVAAGVAGVVVLVLLVWGWSAWGKRSAVRASEALSEGLARVHPEPPPPGGLPDAATRYTEALPSFEEAARLGPKDGAGRVAEFYRAVALLEGGRTADAMAALEPLASSGEEDLVSAVARAKLAQAYLAAGQADRAIETWRELARSSSGYYAPDIALYQAADALYGTGRTAEAKQLLEDVTAQYPQGPAAEDVRMLLQKVGGTTAIPVR